VSPQHSIEAPVVVAFENSAAVAAVALVAAVAAERETK
jgi:hypothetical protein